MTAEQKIRIHDFKRRASCAPDSVYHHCNRGWSYIPVHHFADESDVPAPSVDCWCLLGGDAALLECQRSEHASLEPGLYARVDAESPCWPKLHAVVTESLTREVIEAAMERFVELGFPDRLLSELRPGGTLARLDS
jgi:hypothetical protein